MNLLIKNARVFGGRSGRLADGHILVEGRTFTAVQPGVVVEDDRTTVLDAAGRVAMPGMIDAHVHLVGMANTFLDLMMASHSQVVAATLARARGTLDRGFTTVRDMAGDTAGIRKVIDANPQLGPRIYPSQSAISQTAGHGDFGIVDEPPVSLGGNYSRAEQLGLVRVADGEQQVLAAVREQLKRGAAQIKLMVGGGVASLYDPLYTLQFTPAEIRAAVAAAQDYGTYVAAHVYTVAGIERAIEAGVTSIEHGHLADEPTVAMLAERGAWLSTQPFAEADHNFLHADGAAKNREVCDGTDRLYAWARKHGVNTAWGSDLLFEPDRVGVQSEMVVRLGRYMSNIDALKMVTSGNAALLRLAGERDPYRGARLGEITPGAWADLLLVDGDPTTELSLLARPESNIVVIVKDGVIVKNTL